MNERFYQRLDREPDCCLYCKVVIKRGICLCKECNDLKPAPSVYEYWNNLSCHPDRCECYPCKRTKVNKRFEQVLEACRQENPADEWDSYEEELEKTNQK